MIIIADIAGQYDALLRLINKLPKEEIVLLGDLVDRGPKSKEVIQWAIDNQITSVLGNHEHMMIDYYSDLYSQYDRDIWIYNGGYETKNQYIDNEKILKLHLNWLQELPLYIETDELFISHAMQHPDAAFPEICDIRNYYDITQTIIWNRQEPIKRGKFQVCGHNSQWGLRWFEDWAVCLDASSSKVLTAMQWPSKKIYQEPYEESV